MRKYLVYKTTNNINGSVYVGVHSTEKLNDGYMGSGDLIIKAMRKYGKENFTREILLEAANEEEMYAAEVAIVDKAFVKRKDTYNIAIGGQGGSKNPDYVNNARQNMLDKWKSGIMAKGIAGSALHKEASIERARKLNIKRWCPENKAASVKKLREVHMKTFVVINPDMTRHYVASMGEYIKDKPHLDYGRMMEAGRGQSGPKGHKGNIYKGHQVIIVKESKRNLK